jgi:hypothetical protein
VISSLFLKNWLMLIKASRHRSSGVAKQAKKSPEFFAVLDRQTRKALLPPDTQACFIIVSECTIIP